MHGTRSGRWNRLAGPLHDDLAHAATDGRFHHAQVRAMHALDHKNVLKFYAWCVLCFSNPVGTIPRFRHQYPIGNLPNRIDCMAGRRT